MERRYLTVLARVVGGSVCQSRRQRAQTVVKAESSNEDEVLLGTGFPESREGTRVELGIKIQPFSLQFVEGFPLENTIGQYL